MFGPEISVWMGQKRDTSYATYRTSHNNVLDLTPLGKFTNVAATFHASILVGTGTTFINVFECFNISLETAQRRRAPSFLQQREIRDTNSGAPFHISVARFHITPSALYPGAIQGEEGIKFCSVA